MFHGEDQVRKALKYRQSTLCPGAVMNGIDLACVALVKSRGHDENLSELLGQGNKEITIANCHKFMKEVNDVIVGRN